MRDLDDDALELGVYRFSIKNLICLRDNRVLNGVIIRMEILLDSRLVAEDLLLEIDLKCS